jgi:ABC-type uncharacterized transport system ATPase subunit
LSEAPPVLLQAQDLKVCRDSAREADLAVLGGSAVVLAGSSRPFLEKLAAVLAGIERPWCGRITAGRLSVPVTEKRAKAAIGFLRRGAGCPPGVPPVRFLRLLAAAMGLGARQARDAVAEVLRWCSLNEAVISRPEDLTPEQHTQIAFAAAVLQNPSLFISQAPLPPVLFRQIEDLKAIGKAVVLTADYLGSIPPCADRIVLCDSTDMVRVISRADLAKLCSGASDVHVSFCPALPRAALEEVPGLTGLVATDDGFSFSHLSPSAAVASISALARANSRALTSLEIRSPSISALLGSGPADQPEAKEQDLFFPQERG